MFLSYFHIKQNLILVLQIWVIFAFLNNTSHLARPIRNGPLLLAHRALGQVYSREGLTTETCTAAKLVPTDHGLIENTLASMETSFALGAKVVEIDVHLTQDDRFAVFHDWELDCRTEGTGLTREHTLANLQTLDVGYGYTADSGKTFPFRGKGVGLMPSLEEVLATFPDQNFMIDIKSKDPGEGEKLAMVIQECNATRTGEIWVYGGGPPVSKVRAAIPRDENDQKTSIEKMFDQLCCFGLVGICAGGLQGMCGYGPQKLRSLPLGMA